MLPDSDPAIASRLAAKLSDNGFLILPDLMPTAQVAALNADLAPAFSETAFSEGDFYGPRTRRFGTLLSRSPKAADFVAHPLILAISDAILAPFCDNLQLNLTQGLAIHPGAAAQPPHRDQDMWWGETGRIEYLVNVMWPFTDYTEANGATRIWPHSHEASAQAAEAASDPIVAEMAPGAALLFLGSTLHGGGANRSQMVRRGMIISYCLGWLKPYENQWLAYPPDVARHFAPSLAALIGYRQHRPNLGNVEGRCPSLLLGQAPTGPIGAVDALRPEQATAVAEFAQSQL